MGSAPHGKCSLWESAPYAKCSLWEVLLMGKCSIWEVLHMGSAPYEKFSKRDVFHVGSAPTSSNLNLHGITEVKQTLEIPQWEASYCQRQPFVLGTAISPSF